MTHRHVGGDMEGMPRRILLGPFRCLVQVGLALLGLVTAMVAVAAAAIVVPYPLAAAAIAAQASLGRRLAGAWAGVEIPTPARSPVPEPPRRADGWYVHDNQLYKRRRFPAFMLRLEWLSADPSRLREFTWTFVTPITGMVAVAVPVLLVGGGTGVALLRPWPPVVTAAGAAAAIIAGFALGPAALRAHALFSRSLLQPREESWWHRSALGGWIHRSSQATWHGAGLAGLSVAAFGVGVLTLIATVVSWGGLVPPAATITRPFLDFYRRKAAEWTGREIPDPYRPLPAPPEIDQYGTYQAGRSLHRTRESAVRAQRYNWMLKDPATWRDLLWMLVTPIVAVVGFIPAVLVGFGFFGLVWQPAWWAPWAVPIGLTTGEWVTPWYVWYGITLLWPAAAVVPPWASVGVGLALSLAGCLLALALLRLRSGFDRWLLGPTRATQLAQRVSRLTETRADAIDAQAAELRRIERDLHDGAQARLVAVGLSLATIEALLTHDPEAARALLGQARESSATALAELRDLVRGIHPPVLAERGLVDAVRAVALDSPLPVTVTADLPGRPAAPVESAAYFATSEALANASRHGKAIEVDIGHRDGRLTITVTDDGRGGADPSRGTGLRGMQRRLATFDGTLTIDSPTGGPTVLTMEIPCALSSPRTSTSFGTA